MIRSLASLALVGLLAACASGGGAGWDGGRGSTVRWSGPYGGPFYGYDGYGYRRDPFAVPQRRARVFRPGGDVVCDRRTQTCYRDGEIDASETRDFFGNRAGRRVDRLRDAAGTNSIFRPDDDIVCNRRQRVCYKDGHPDRSETRDFFGKKAGRRIK